jgi:taurine transport system substrate-binding protein
LKKPFWFNGKPIGMELLAPPQWQCADFISDLHLQASEMPTFSAWVATGAFAKEHPEFLKAFSGVIEKHTDSFVGNKAAWNKDSDNARQLAKLLGGTPADQAAGLLHLNLVPVSAQASDAWLGGGEKSGIARILKETAVFLKEQKKISDVLPSYAAFVTPTAVAALKQ